MKKSFSKLCSRCFGGCFVIGCVLYAILSSVLLVADPNNKLDKFDHTSFDVHQNNNNSNMCTTYTSQDTPPPPTHYTYTQLGCSGTQSFVTSKAQLIWECQAKTIKSFQEIVYQDGEEHELKQCDPCSILTDDEEEEDLSDRELDPPATDYSVFSLSEPVAKSKY